jgi:hypothetical protein
MARHDQVTVNDNLEDSWAAWFDDLAISHASDGATTLAGSVRDQSALYGLIGKARPGTNPGRHRTLCPARSRGRARA